jgi:ankyrin repeat protein
MLASALGREDVVIGLLGHQAALEAKDSTGATALMKAVLQSQPEIAKILLSAGANPNTANHQRMTPLMAAIMNGDDAMVDLLIACCSDIETRTTAGITPLLLAVSEGHVALARRLLNAGADANKPDHNGWTPLVAAAARGHLEIVEVLIEKGADIDATLKKGASAIDFARAGNHSKVEELLRHAAIEKAIRTDIESREFRQLRTNLYAMEHPSGWQTFRDNESPEICIASRGAVLQSEGDGVQVGYGLILSYYPPQDGRGTLADSTSDLIRDLLKENPDMCLESGQWSATPHGHQALVTPLVGNSPFGGSVKQLVVTITRPEGLFCMFFVAPPYAWPGIRNVFDRMLGSLQFSMNANSFSV